MFVMCVDECCLLTVIFKAHLSVGAVKYFALPATQRVAQQLVLAQKTRSLRGLDLSVLNLADPSEFSGKRTEGLGLQFRMRTITEWHGLRMLARAPRNHFGFVDCNFFGA